MRILYLEDEAIIALETAEALREMGFGDVALVYSLEAAGRALTRGLPDMALLDVNLSHGRTSFDLGRRLLDAGVPVVFATGYARATLPADPRATVVEKPCTTAALERALRSAVSAPDPCG